MLGFSTICGVVGQRMSQSACLFATIDCRSTELINAVIEFLNTGIQIRQSSLLRGVYMAMQDQCSSSPQAKPHCTASPHLPQRGDPTVPPGFAWFSAGWCHWVASGYGHSCLGSGWPCGDKDAGVASRWA